MMIKCISKSQQKLHGYRFTRNTNAVIFLPKGLIKTMIVTADDLQMNKKFAAR